MLDMPWTVECHHMSPLHLAGADPESGLPAWIQGWKPQQSIVQGPAICASASLLSTKVRDLTMDAIAYQMASDGERPTPRVQPKMTYPHFLGSFERPSLPLLETMSLEELALDSLECMKIMKWSVFQSSMVFDFCARR